MRAWHWRQDQGSECTIHSHALNYSPIPHPSILVHTNIPTYLYQSKNQASSTAPGVKTTRLNPRSPSPACFRKVLTPRSSALSLSASSSSLRAPLSMGPFIPPLSSHLQIEFGVSIFFIYEDTQESHGWLDFNNTKEQEDENAPHVMEISTSCSSLTHSAINIKFITITRSEIDIPSRHPSIHPHNPRNRNKKLTNAHPPPASQT